MQHAQWTITMMVTIPARDALGHVMDDSYRRTLYSDFPARLPRTTITPTTTSVTISPGPSSMAAATAGMTKGTIAWTIGTHSVDY